MAAAGSSRAVITAIIGNLIVTLAKAGAAAVSGSGAMIAESVHSLVDTLNQCLLLVGHRRSLYQPTPRFPYGFGAEVSFWGLLAAIGISALGGGLTILHAIHALQHPTVPSNVGWVYLVLGFSTLVEGAVLVSVIRGILRSKGSMSFWRYTKSQGAGTITVLLEDSAAIAGCILAGIAVYFSVLTQNGIYDALLQLIIGIMLTFVGLYLVWYNRGALLGEAMPEEVVQQLSVFIADFPAIDRVTDIKTRQLAAGRFTLKAEVVFSGGEIAGAVMPQYLDRIVAAGSKQKAAELLGRYSEKLFVRQAELVDQYEADIAKRFPGAVHIDLEPHRREQQD